MSNNICNELVNEYTQWLRENITVTDVGTGCEITTPFTDRHNDYLQIYLQRDGDKFKLTDDGYILSDLRSSGVEITTGKRAEILQTILRGLDVILDENELMVYATRENLAQQQHQLTQAMLAVNNLYVIAKPKVASLFYEDVERFLRLHQIQFTPKPNFLGKTGYEYEFDFAIPPSEQAPERLIKAINTPTRDNVSSLIFSLNDTRKSRPDHSQAIAFLNDTNNEVSTDTINALDAYEIKHYSWTTREESISYLSK